MPTIGGPNYVVQIDECKIGRQKFHRGRVVEGNGILGMMIKYVKIKERERHLPDYCL